MERRKCTNTEEGGGYQILFLHSPNSYFSFHSPLPPSTTEAGHANYPLPKLVLYVVMNDKVAIPVNGIYRKSTKVLAKLLLS